MWLAADADPVLAGKIPTSTRGTCVIDDEKHTTSREERLMSVKYDRRPELSGRYEHREGWRCLNGKWRRTWDHEPRDGAEILAAWEPSASGDRFD